MPERKTIQRALKKKREGKSPSTQAGEFVHEEIEHIRQGKHGARSAKQAIAIGLSKARKAGVKLPPYKNQKTPKTATAKKPSKRRSQAMLKVLKKEPKTAASHRSLSRQTRAAAKKKGPLTRHETAKKAARTRAAHLAFR